MNEIVKKSGRPDRGRKERRQESNPARCGWRNRIIVGAIGGLIVATLAALVWRLPRPTPSQQAVRQLQAATPVDVRWNESTGIPDWLDGPLPYTLSPAEQADPDLAARGILNHYRGIFGLQSAAAEFELVRVESDALGQRHVRLQQIKDGVPVFGRVLIVHLDDARALGINGDYQPALSVPTVPAIAAAQAEASALAASGGAPRVFAPSRLMIYIDEETRQPALTWQVRIETASPVERMAYFVNARDGRIAHRLPLTATDRYREIYDAQLKDNLPGRLLASEGTVPRDPDGAAVYKNSGIVYDYFKNTFGRDSYDNKGGPIYIAIHSPELGNSYWNGEMLVFGDKDDYIANQNDAQVLDIMAHEFTHGVVQYTADLAYETQSGALNESFADVFAVMVDREDWHLFEDNSASPPLPRPWLRDMQDPTLGGDYNPKKPRDGFGQPALMKDYANLPNTRDGDWGGVHVNSGIPNHVLYLAAIASSREAAEQIWYRALATYLTPKSDFKDFAAAIQKSAEDLYGANSKEARAVDSALVTSGIISASAVPTAQPTPAPQATLAPTPVSSLAAGCSELIDNGTFESVRAAPWVERTTLNTPIIGADFPHTGAKSAWLGGTDRESLQYIYQDLAIAANLTSVTLNYWHYLAPNVAKGAPDASFEALVADANTGDVIASLETIPSSAAAKQWLQSKIDMTDYAGKKVRLAFTANMVRGNLSNFFVDDVSLVGCPGGPPAPATGGPTAGVTGTIADASTGRPVDGAIFYVLNTTVANATNDGKISGDEIMAQGTSDLKGSFRLDKKLPRGAHYNVVVIASGYKTIAADKAFNLTASDPDPINLDVRLQKR